MPETHRRVSLPTRMLMTRSPPARRPCARRRPSSTPCARWAGWPRPAACGLDVVGPVEPDDERHLRVDLVERLDQPARDLVAAGDAAEDVEQHGLDLGVGEDDLDGLGD